MKKTKEVKEKLKELETLFWNNNEVIEGNEKTFYWIQALRWVLKMNNIQAVEGKEVE